MQSLTDAGQIKNFLWSELSAAEEALFQNRCASVSKLSQCQNLGSTKQAEFPGERLLNYLRGQYGFKTELKII